VSILVSIFKHDSNTHWRKEVWGHLTSKCYVKTPNLIVYTILLYSLCLTLVYIAAGSNFAPGIAIKSLPAANGHKYCVNFILDDKMLHYCHVFLSPKFKAYMCQQYVRVLSATSIANGQTWHEYALTAVNSPMRLSKG